MANAQPASGVLLLDKPAGITSTRALALAKKALAASKGGHTGTLDPFATGLLPLVFGEATKFSRFLIDATKAYEATLRLGETTPTGDTESPATATGVDVPKSERIDEVISMFTGVRDQTPPMHSAVHVGGKRLYEYAREGAEVERSPRSITVYELAQRSFKGSELVLAVSCSKGTYIRVLAAELGEALGCGAHLVALRRTAVGPFRVEDAVSLEELQGQAADWGRARLLPPQVLVEGLEAITLDREEARRFADGQRIAGPEGMGSEVAVFGSQGQFMGVATRAEGGVLVPARLMATDAKPPDFA